ncbi:VOC family protein [Conexibacter sp. SYSU D00693]|uniref:VOC family protein n=1 Tax=Conexibacter sp. SYSU D00693 TaxID=2812560 RepID=UPI00196B85B9|nr:VOC family protein [Conexibacter sp. SYSU D00693]
MLPDGLRLGPAELVVRDLERSIAFYRDVLGLRVHARDERSAALGAGEEDVLRLHLVPDARPAGRHAGLYHVALLFPTREELARVATRLATTRTGIQGASDHGTHEAIYLPDPDGNGLELAADRPREQWPDVRNPYAMGPQPLDTRGLLATVEDEPPSAQAATGLRVGHVHLHVGDLDRAVAHYRDVLGFQEMARMDSAVFVAAGGYHHHVGLNTWKGEGAGPVPDGVAGLRRWTVVLGDGQALRDLVRRAEAAGAQVRQGDEGAAIRDAWGIELLAVV